MNEFSAPASLPPQYPIPMSFGQILDRIYRLMRANLKLFIGIAAVPAGALIPIMALVFAVAFVPILAQQQRHSDPGAALYLMVPAILVAMVLNLAVFALYLDETAADPLWTETQTVLLDDKGGYAVLLGAGTEGGLPAKYFASGVARWLGVRPAGQNEQPRIQLASVPSRNASENPNNGTRNAPIACGVRSRKCPNESA